MTQSAEVIAHIDGASRGNPGPAAYAVVMESSDGARLAGFSEFFGEATNNVAEYQALLAALEYALRNHYLRIHVQTDSELLARQLAGVYKVKSPALKLLRERAQQMIARLESFSIEHVSRQENQEADRLANRALDAEGGGKRRRAVITPPLTPLPARGGESQPVPGLLTPLPVREGESGAGDASKDGTPLRVSATFHKGLLEPQGQLSLLEGEVVDLEIHRKG